jgi:ABC-type dipeptide/oligopeptide/nickel transport system permease component
LGVLPPSGRPVSLLKDPAKAAKYLLLPSLSLGLAQGAALSRFIKNSLLEVMMQDYIRTARAKGLRERVVIARHALRNAMIPVATVMGINIARLLSGAVILETVFAWPGLGRLTIEAVNSRDYAVVQGTLLLAVLVVLFVNLAVDLAYGIVDPRIRL